MDKSQNSQNKSSFLQQKRDQFANEIRRNQRRQIISQKRKILFPELMGNSANSEALNQNVDFNELLNNFQTKYNLEWTYKKILQMMRSPNYNYTYLISAFFDKGSYSILLFNLVDRKFLEQTLALFSFMISKQDFKYADLLISKSFIECILELIPIKPQSILIILNILTNLCIEKDDYCEILLANNTQSFFIDLFNRIFQEFKDNKTSQNPQKKLQSILFLFDLLVSTQQSALDFSHQYDEILYFCKFLLQEKRHLKGAIIVVKGLAYKNPQKVQQVIHPIVNQLLHQQTGESPFYQNLLVLVKILSPGRFLYKIIFEIAIKAKWQLLKQTIEILHTIKSSQAALELAKHQHWWERIFTRIDSKKTEFKVFITIVRHLNINYSCVWRFVSEYLDEAYDNGVVCEVLVFLKRSLMSAPSCGQNSVFQLLQNLNRNRIPACLQKIAYSQNYQRSSNAQQLLHLMNNLKKNFKDKFQIQIQS